MNRKIEGQTPAEDSWRRTTRIWKTTTEWLRTCLIVGPLFSRSQTGDAGES